MEKPVETLPLAVRGLTLSYGANNVVHHVSLDIARGGVTVLVGGNGCGKSTLLKACARLLRPVEGSVLLDGRAIQGMSTAQVARELAILPQTPLAPDGITVFELVRLGRYPHQSWRQQWSRRDQETLERVLHDTGLEACAHLPVDALSGGQRQRAWIAMTLAQDTGILLLDEPTTYLDLAYQIEVLDLLRDLNQTHGKTIVMVLHDLNLAARYAHHMIAMRQGRVHAQGRPADVMTATTVEAVFGLRSRIIEDPVTGTPLCVPIGRVPASGLG
ncbi:ABC-type Fe3+-siderophore transport system, ATPase component [plant metagenome]|uniref:ABC-type Fe3+-siderophore transport system, ATPase component n=1 Tax=plant metagenome TaxID=1297885 RepID=A0A484QYW2_9ZZZZ